MLPQSNAARDPGELTTLLLMCISNRQVQPPASVHSAHGHLGLILRQLLAVRNTLYTATESSGGAICFSRSFCGLFGPSLPLFPALGWIHLCSYFSDNSSWVARYDCEIRDVLCYNAPSSHHAASANRDSRKDNNVPANPTIFSNVNLFAQFGTTSPLTNGWVQRMCSGVERYIRTNQSAGTDRDHARVNENRVKVDKHALSETDVVAIVHS
jgi:hypothetical protein